MAQPDDPNRITAPYGFVPLGPVVEPPWLQPALTAPFLHDVPFEDGLSGTFELVVEAETPICVAGRSEGPERRPFKLGTKYALPGSSLRGALRNVVEIASFSRMTLVNDHRYAVRDLQNRKLYLDHMAAIQTNVKNHKKEPMPLVNAGWLTFTGDEGTPATIEVCHFAKIEYDLIKQRASALGIQGFEPGEKQSSVDKYKKWGGKSLKVKVPVMLARQPQPPRVLSQFAKVERSGLDVDGELVFTGQPQRHDAQRKPKGKGAGNAKHHDFVFYGATGRTIAVETKKWRDFQFAHANRGQQNRMDEAPNEEWGYWKAHLQQAPGNRMPVFFLLEPDGSLRAFGLAMMFRLANRYSIVDAIRRNDPAHAPESPKLDLAEGLFGTVRKIQPADAAEKTFLLRGRVQIGHAEAMGSPKEEPVRRIVLGAPKASYYPNYVTQDERGGHVRRDRDDRPDYTTWMDDGARLRGWKRYHAQTKPAQPFVPAKVNLEKVGTAFCPLPPKTVFRALVNVHNLRPPELGALLWAIDFGGAAEARHGLGLGRPLGYGRVRLMVEKWDVRRVRDGGAVDATGPSGPAAAFATYMESALGGGWASSAQVRELVAIARPKAPEDVRYQRLDSESRLNEFVGAKKEGLALPRQVDAPSARLTPARSDGGPGHEPGPSPVSRGPAPTPTKRPWPGMRRGETLDVVLDELNKKGKWRGHAVAFDAFGVIDGAPPTGADKGQTHTVEIVTGGDPKNLNLKWRGS